jgi:replication-associated recombination protein RarA
MAKHFEHGPTRRGYSPYDVVSAMQKAVRRSQVQETVYWAMELYISGHAAWMWNRFEEMVSEDIGPADRYLPATIKALRQTSDEKRKKKKAGGMEAVHAAILLATAPKNGIACWMVMVATGNHHERFEIPDEAKDMHTRAGRQLNRGVDHFVEEGAKKIQPQNRWIEAGFEDEANWLHSIGADYLEQWHDEMNKQPHHENPKDHDRDETWVPPAQKADAATLFDDQTEGD